MPLDVLDQSLHAFDDPAKSIRRSPRLARESLEGLRVELPLPLVRLVCIEGRWTIANRPTFRRVADGMGSRGCRQSRFQRPSLTGGFDQNLPFLPESNTVDSRPLQHLWAFFQRAPSGLKESLDSSRKPGLQRSQDQVDSEVMGRGLNEDVNVLRHEDIGDSPARSILPPKSLVGYDQWHPEMFTSATRCSRGALSVECHRL